MMANSRIYLFLALAALLIVIPARIARAQKMELVAAGELEFHTSCAVCHGVDARGRGIMSKHYRIIEGRGVVPGHGSRDMPIWGDRFRADARGNGKVAQAQAAGRILSVVFYLEHMQE